MEEARQKGRGKGKGKGAGDAPRAGKGKGKSQPRAGKGSGQEQASAIRLDPILEAAYQAYLSGRRADQPRVSRAAWLRNNVRSDSTVRAAVRNRMEAVRGGPIAGPPAAPPPKGESALATPRQPPPPPKPRPRGPPGVWVLQTTPASSAAPPAKAKAATTLDSSSSSSSSSAEEQREATPWARRTARKTTSAKHSEHAQHQSQAPVQAAQWTPEEMEPGALSSTSSEVMEDAPLVESISLGEVASALQLASEEAPDAAEAPANPASPGSDTLPGSAPSPSSPAHSVSAQADQALPRESAKAEVVDSTPPDKAAAADPGASGSVQPNPGPETLEVECREGLRAQWLSFVYRPEECAAATLGRCRDQAAMSSLDTLCVWPDKGELDLGLSLSDSLRPGERRLLATAPAQGSASSVASRPRKPVTSEDGLFCFACKQRAPSVEHMSSHFMTSAHVQAVRAYMAQ